MGAAIAAVVTFLWHTIFWSVLPISDNTLGQVTNQVGLQTMLDAALPESGVYMLPYPDGVSEAEYQTLHAKGPIATIYIRKEGSEPMAPGTFALGYGHEFMVLLIMGLMLKVSGLAAYGTRLAVVFLGGVAGSVFAQFSGPIWWMQPWDMAIVNVIYESVSWFLGALVLAFFIQPAGRRDSNEM
jgi:hypothetical protein